VNDDQDFDLEDLINKSLNNSNNKIKNDSQNSSFERDLNSKQINLKNE
jgi:hypothetical protein